MWTYNIDEGVVGVGSGSGTASITKAMVENLTQGTTLLDTTSPAEGAAILAAVAGDVLRFSFDGQASILDPDVTATSSTARAGASYQLAVVTIPEPSGIVMATLALAATLCRRRRNW